jgi:hypothetical protein
MVWTSPDPVQGEAPAWVAPDPVLGEGRPRSAQGFWDSVTANWQASSAGLYLRGETPEVFANPELPWYQRIGGSLAGLAGDLPAMAVGGFAGAALPLPPAAKPVLSGAGAFAAPAAVREALMQYYSTGEVDWGRVSVVAGKEAAVGAVTFWAGGAVSKILPGAAVGASTAERVAQGLGRQAAIGGAELGAMMTARSVVDWKIPESHEFIDNAVLIFGLRAAREYGVPALMRVYERTGKTPAEVAADAARDSNIAQELLQGRTPEAYRALEIEARGEMRPEMAPPRRASDPAPEPIQRAAHNLRHIGDEATMRAELTRAGADHIAAIEAARRGTVSRGETLAAAEQSAAWLRETLGEGKATREVGTPAGDAQIVGYAKVLDQLFGDTREAAARLEQAKAAKAAPEEVAVLRGEYARVEQQLRAVTADYLGATAELGRAMRAIRYIKDAVGDVKKLDEALNKAGGARGIDFRSGMIADLSSNRQLARFVREAGKFDAVIEWWKASVLSGPTTQVINFLSNTTFSLSRVPRTFAAAMVSEARGKNTVLYREAAAEAVGMAMGMTEGFRAAGKVFQNAWRDQGGPEIAGKAEIHKVAIGGTTGKIVRTPFQLLEAADAFSKTINGYATAYAAAARASKGDAAKLMSKEFWQAELPKAKADEAVMAQIQADALRYTFQTELGPRTKRLLGALYDTPARYVLPFFLPFVRTPVNIYGEAVRMMPGLAILSNRGRDAWKEGGVAREKMVADQMVGGAVALSVVALADAGLISGSGPVDPAERRALRERGWQPFSIRFGDQWYSYARIEPFATLIGATVDLWGAKQYASKGEYEVAGRALALAFRSQVTDKTWLLGVSNLINLATPDEYGGVKVGQAIGDIVGGFIPNLGAQTDRELDSHIRDARGFVDKITNRVPILRRGLLPMRDSLGEPLTPDSLFPFSGITVSREKGDPVREELARLGYAPEPMRDREFEVVPGPLKGEIEISPEQLDSLRTRAGQVARTMLERVMSSPGYQGAPREYQRAAVEQIFSQARTEARARTIPVEKIQEAVNKAAAEARNRDAVK